MLCAISGEAPQAPVASRKSGNVFERRLIEAYIQENGTDPVTGEELAAEDLVDLKTARVVKPRPPTLTSIPALLSVFQNEWDALTLETHTLKQHLGQLRQELSTALYQNDAAVRVIARLTKERDEARDALGKLSLNERRAVEADGEVMQVDGPSLPEALAQKVDATKETLSKGRRKRPVPDDWATAETIQSLQTSTQPSLLKNARSLAVNESGSVAVLGSDDGSYAIYPLDGEGETITFNTGLGPLNALLLRHEDGEPQQVITATEKGIVAVFADGQESASFSGHAGAATSLALHPCKEIFASVGADKSFVFYDLTNRRQISQSYTNSKLNCCQFHPDGHIFAVGGSSGQIQVFDVKTSANVANFDLAGPVKDISFSENGTWLAAVTEGSTSVAVWDLRKAAAIKELEFGGAVNHIQWDYTGQYLAGAGPAGVTVQYYDKATKAWSEPLRKGASVAGVAWGAKAKSLILANPEGSLEILS